MLLLTLLLTLRQGVGGGSPSSRDWVSLALGTGPPVPWGRRAESTEARAERTVGGVMAGLGGLAGRARVVVTLLCASRTTRSPTSSASSASRRGSRSSRWALPYTRAPICGTAGTSWTSWWSSRGGCRPGGPVHGAGLGSSVHTEGRCLSVVLTGWVPAWVPCAWSGFGQQCPHWGLVLLGGPHGWVLVDRHCSSPGRSWV